MYFQIDTTVWFWKSLSVVCDRKRFNRVGSLGASLWSVKRMKSLFKISVFCMDFYYNSCENDINLHNLKTLVELDHFSLTKVIVSYKVSFSSKSHVYITV